MPDFSVLPPLALYIHIPWCVRKCPYCDFNSHELKTTLPERDYIDALLLDLQQDLPRVWGRTVQTVFIGGGTPSLFAAEGFDRLLAGLRSCITLDPAAEITLEANPGTIEAERFSEYRATGINRLSIGIQSFNDDLLQALGRIHGRREAVRAAELAHHAGYDNFNLDLMFALPGQSLQQAAKDMADAIALEPAHISYYQLTLEPNTWFHHHPPTLPGEDLACDIQRQGQEQLAQHGFQQYEVSAYARPDRQCRHNLNYWQFGDYLGIGAGAHGKISSTSPMSITRLWKVKRPSDYLQRMAAGNAVSGEKQLADAEIPLEFMLNALRLTRGFKQDMYRQHTGLNLDGIRDSLQISQDKQLLQVDDDMIRPTAAGQRYLNDLVGLFIDEHNP